MRFIAAATVPHLNPRPIYRVGCERREAHHLCDLATHDVVDTESTSTPRRPCDTHCIDRRRPERIYTTEPVMDNSSSSTDEGLSSPSLCFLSVLL